jgi:hypothetical protein
VEIVSIGLERPLEFSRSLPALQCEAPTYPLWVPLAPLVTLDILSYLKIYLPGSEKRPRQMIDLDQLCRLNR